ncbi:MAG: hypothetical protein OEZ02_05650 [Anaerolineae bacterium]|nr:hypothetical protein [Anaerolineae bacterium]
MHKLRSKRAANWLILAALLAVLVTGAAMQPARAQQNGGLSTPELIKAGVRSGVINMDTAYLYMAYALTDYKQLPPAFQGNVPWHGTLLYQEMLTAYEGRTGYTFKDQGIKDRITATLGLNNPQALTNCGGSYLVNFSTNTTNFHVTYNTITDPVLTITNYTTSLETTWATEITSFGWAAPPVYAANPAPGSRYHVIIADLGTSLYGYVTTSGTYTGYVGNNPNTAWNDVDAYASCMVLNNDYSGFPGSSQQALDATAAHEFAHSLQFGLGALTGANAPDDNYIEGIATWMEDEVFDSSNDNYNYLWPTFTQSMENYSASPYPYWITWRGLTERYGTGAPDAGEQVMHDFWNDISQNSSASSLIALDTALGNKGLNLPMAFHDYAIAVKFKKACAGNYILPYCFEEAAGYPGTPGLTAVIGSVGGSHSGSVQDSFAINWVSLPASASPYPVTFSNTSAGGILRASLVCDTGSELLITEMPQVVNGLSTKVPSFNPVGCSSRVAVITNESTATAGTLRTYTLSTAGSVTSEIKINRSFEAAVPDGWTGKLIDPRIDATDCSVSRSGSCSYRMANNSDNSVLLSYFPTTGATSDVVSLSVWDMADNVAGVGSGLLRLVLIYTDESKEILTVPFSGGTHTWEQKTVAITAAKPYRMITTSLIATRSQGTFWFDDVSLTVNAGANLFSAKGPGFENSVPEKWVGKLLAPNVDGMDCTAAARTGYCSYHMNGNGDNSVVLSYYPRTGATSDAINLSVYNRTNSAGGTGSALLRLVIIYNDETKDILTVPFNTGTHGWEQVTINHTAIKDYRMITVSLIYTLTLGDIWWDDISLTVN